VGFFETPSAALPQIGREQRGSPADALLDAVGRRSAAHVAFRAPDLAAAMADAGVVGPALLGDSPEDGLGPYRRAFLAAESHVGIPFGPVEPR
jgi:threonine dehydrogenase-like Zn-dependent dehydrogenase